MIYRYMKDRTAIALSLTSWPRWQRVAAIIALLLLAAFLGKSHLYQELGRETGVERQASHVIVTSHSEDKFHYFRSGQWRADLRSLVAACKYLLQPDWA